MNEESKQRINVALESSMGAHRRSARRPRGMTTWDTAYREDVTELVQEVVKLEREIKQLKEELGRLKGDDSMVYVDEEKVERQEREKGYPPGSLTNPLHRTSMQEQAGQFYVESRPVRVKQEEQKVSSEDVGEEMGTGGGDPKED